MATFDTTHQLTKRPARQRLLLVYVHPDGTPVRDRNRAADAWEVKHTWRLRGAPMLSWVKFTPVEAEVPA